MCYPVCAQVSHKRNLAIDNFLGEQQEGGMMGLQRGRSNTMESTWYKNFYNTLFSFLFPPQCRVFSMFHILIFFYSVDFSLLSLFLPSDFFINIFKSYMMYTMYSSVTFLHRNVHPCCCPSRPSTQAQYLVTLVKYYAWARPVARLIFVAYQTL